MKGKLVSRRSQDELGCGEWCRQDQAGVEVVGGSW